MVLFVYWFDCIHFSGNFKIIYNNCENLTTSHMWIKDRRKLKHKLLCQGFLTFLLHGPLKVKKKFRGPLKSCKRVQYGSRPLDPLHGPPVKNLCFMRFFMLIRTCLIIVQLQIKKNTNNESKYKQSFLIVIKNFLGMHRIPAWNIRLFLFLKNPTPSVFRFVGCRLGKTFFPG